MCSSLHKLQQFFEKYFWNLEKTKQKNLSLEEDYKTTSH